jgi:ABC-type polysaccharide/polyol phosphate export permease
MIGNNNVKESMKLKFFNSINEIHTFRFVLMQLVRQHLVLRYRRTFLGYMWTLINPLITMSITAIVFSTLLGMDLKAFVVYLFAGLMCWNCFSSIVTQSSSCFIVNEALIKKIYLPKIIFPLSQSLSVLIDSFLSFIAIYLIIYLIDSQFFLGVLFIPFAYIILAFFSFGVALIFSVATVFYRDLQYVISILMQAWYFLTPVMYKITNVSPDAAFLIRLNPVTPFVELFQNPLFHHQMPDLITITTCCLYSVISLTLGLIVFTINKDRLIYRL